MLTRKIVILSGAILLSATLAAISARPAGARPADGQGRAGAPADDAVTAITPPAQPLPPEAESAGVSQFSFLVYGDTRGPHDGSVIQAAHAQVVDAMLASVKRLAASSAPVKFVLQSGDAVANGAIGREWNVSFTPIVNRLTQEGGVSYFLVPGNHDVSGAETVTVPGRQAGLRNYLAAMAKLMPPDGSPRRLSGYPTYAFGYGNTFVLGLDADVAGDDTQFQWVKAQFDGLDRSRYPNLIVFCHQAPFSSGPHGGSVVEVPTEELRARYMPLFQAHHVRVVFSGHEHLFEHWVERYTDAGKPYRMDLIVSGGGGAPIYTYRGEPDVKAFLAANRASHVTLEHLVRPGVEAGQNPYHYLVVHVDGARLDVEVVGVDWGANFQPYRSNRATLEDVK